LLLIVGALFPIVTRPFSDRARKIAPNGLCYLRYRLR